ncbi:phage Gp37/Gp68 family protein [Nocardia sp. NPDC057227]|uniref:phage Gp37/Gp68 family protein n=1 Tax=Nocardia sp. NPDC057227 TaxID=3346056 RepID=UPI00362F2327
MTKIEWTDRTWNPVTGCDKVSPGCDHCYAEGIANRFAGTPQFPNGFGVTLRPERLAQPLRWRKPRRVFVNSMSDLFHDEVSIDYIAKVLAVIALTPQHTYQILTKRHARMRSIVTNRCHCTGGHLDGEHLRSAMAWAVSKANPDRVPGMPDDAEQQVYFEAGWPLRNLWLGVSAEDQKWADIRIPALMETPAAVRFLSAEPLLGPIDLHDTPLDWVIVGGESGRGARPMHPDWARSLRDQCEQLGVAYLFKQWGEWMPNGFWRRDTGRPAGNPREHAFETGGRNGFLPLMARVGKKQAGRELDGRTWDEFPKVVPL